MFMFESSKSNFFRFLQVCAHSPFTPSNRLRLNAMKQSFGDKISFHIQASFKTIHHHGVTCNTVGKTRQHFMLLGAVINVTTVTHVENSSSNNY
jgi:hypothetical protein